MKLGGLTSTLLWVGTCLILSSCLHLFQENSRPQVRGLPNKSLSLIFSQNIFGEITPCGCPRRPLGGVQNLAAIIEKQRSQGPTLYFDLGNTYFPKEIIHAIDRDEKSMTARYLAKSMKALNLKLQIPGPLDFSLGLEFFEELHLQSGSELLITNYKKEAGQLKVRNSVDLKYGPHQFQFFGVLSSELFPSPFKEKLVDPLESLRKKLKRASSARHSFKRTIVLLHGSEKLRRKIKQEFPQVTWVIGLNGDDLKRPEINEKGQVFSFSLEKENHYVGLIQFDLKSSKTQDRATSLEVAEGPFQGPLYQSLKKIMEDHKMALVKIESEKRKKEQAKWKIAGPTKIKTFHQCKECHIPQTNFWKGTGHALAYSTLKRVKMDQVAKCQKCHSLRNVWEQEGTNDFVPLEPPPATTYWRDWEKAFSPQKVIRELSSQDRKALFIKWESLDSRYKVEKNHLNVQCLHCHQMDQHHPFVVQMDLSQNEALAQAKERNRVMKEKCLACHDAGNSPSWYPLSEDLSSRKFKEAFKQVSCPKNQ